MNHRNLIQSRRFRRFEHCVYTLRGESGADVFVGKYWRNYRRWVINNRMGFKHILSGF
jgi:hypothetical protein